MASINLLSDPDEQGPATLAPVPPVSTYPRHTPPPINGQPPNAWQGWGGVPGLGTAQAKAQPGQLSPELIEAIRQRYRPIVDRFTGPTTNPKLPQAEPRPAAPQAPSGPASGAFRDWFMSQVAGKPWTQQTLLDLEPMLQQYGSKLTPANSVGERTKIWDPDLRDWVRVGFSEGAPVWIPQGWGESGPQAQAQGAYQFSDEATKALEKYLNERIEKLKQPAYTGAEWEVFRTAALDPIEADRQAARQRALENIGARGFDPTSGIAQELLGQVDRGFDTSRAKTQNQLAYNRIQEDRSREQEAQTLLTLLYDLPNQSLQQALAVLGMGPSPQGLSNQYMNLWQQQQANNLPWWQAIGALLPYIGR